MSGDGGNGEMVTGDDLGLKPQHEMFVRAYIRDFNGAHAARAAGYEHKMAKKTAYRLLRRPDVRRALNHLLDERRKQVSVDAPRIVMEYVRVALADMADYVKIEDGQVVLDTERISQVIESGEGGLEAVQTFTQDETVTYDKEGNETIKRRTEFKLYDKLRALDSVSRHLGLFERESRSTDREIAPIKLVLNDREVDVLPPPRPRALPEGE